VPEPHTANIIGIDPGTESLGLSIITIDVRSLDILYTQAQTFVGSKLAAFNPWDELTHHARFTRINALRAAITNTLVYYRPLQVISEAPFWNPSRPGAYQALVEICNAIRGAVYDYDPWRSLYMVEPSILKKTIGAKGGDGKDAIKNAVLNRRQELRVINNSELEWFDDHSIDAIGAAYCRVLGLRNSDFYLE
jgi:Holliday junction resolvasome RuvABC endonuclease subunit